MAVKIPPLWPDDKDIRTADGAAFEMASGHRYAISRTLFDTRPNILDLGRVAMTRHILERGLTEGPIAFTTGNIDEILSRHPVPMKDKAWALMTEIVRGAEGKPGQVELKSGPNTRCLDLLRRVGVDSWGEIIWLLKYLNASGLITSKLHSEGASVTLPVEGLIEFEERKLTSTTNEVFVAMWFNAQVAEAYDSAMVPAIERWGYAPIRIDKREHNNKIDDEIISAIRRAKFLVADFSCDETGARGGVYFEAGFAAGLGKPVIFTVREQDLGRVHFDTRQYNHIVWDSSDSLRVALENRIGATIGAATRP